MPIQITSLSVAKRRKRSVDAVITVEDPGTHPCRALRFHTTPHPPHLILAFEDSDVDDGRVRLLDRTELAKVLAFARALPPEASLLVHCLHGVGRSAALGLVLLADRFGPGREGDAVAELFRIQPEATPNLPAVALGDAELGRGGALVGALAAFERETPGMARKREARASLFKKHRYRFANRANPAQDTTGGTNRMTDPEGR